MAAVHCPICGRENTKEAEFCLACGARIKPVLASRPIQAGDQPIKRNTAEFETEKLPDSPPIHAGEVPTRKDDADLEKTLPTWLRTVRSGGEAPGQGTSAGAIPGGQNPLREEPETGSAAGASLNDWLAGLESVGKGEEEAGPDWLSNVHSDQVPELPGDQDSPSLPSAGESEWLDRLAASPSAGAGPERPVPGSSGAGREDQAPDWLASLPGVPAETAPAPLPEAPDWLNQLKGAPIDLPPGEPTGRENGSPSNGNMPDWLSKHSPEDLPASPPTAAGGKKTARGQVPAWLSQLQADASAGAEADSGQGHFDVVEPSREAKKDTGPLPEWLSGIEKPAGQARPTPALISDEKASPNEAGGPPAFSMETPDWLSKIKPDQGVDRSADREADTAEDDLEIAELPSWVQAMRPVESVVSDARGTGRAEEATEENGPLAGLRGVLPSAPGIGTVRKPPAYSAKLEVSEGQQRYAAYLEKLIASEAQPRAPVSQRLRASRIWRWIITLVLFATVLASLSLGLDAPANSLPPSDSAATRALIDALPGGAPVLAAFDYDPALSGELAAVAAPIFDQLLSKGVRLVVISTTPTGSLLANQFLQDTVLVDIYHYPSLEGSQYLNLGYLAGGPAGIRNFSLAPREAMLVDARGYRISRDQPVLAGISILSDFQAVLILTDDADTGRSWIEQAGPQLGTAPMIVIASAQAEPMMRPYFDSGQIKGLVSGLVDAKAYEQLYSRSGLANLYWGTLSLTTVVAVALILLGAFISLVTGLAGQQPRPGKGKSA